MTRIDYSNDERTTEQLLAALKSHNWVERRGVAQTLAYRADRSAVEPLIECLSDSKPQVRDQAILSLGMLGDKRAIEPLIAMFSNPECAYHAARALSWIRSRTVVKPLNIGIEV